MTDTRLRLLRVGGWGALCMTGLCIAALLERGPFDTTLIVVAALVYGVLSISALSAQRWGSVRHQRIALWMLWMALATEGLVQLLAVGKLIPGISIRETAPMGRVYWTKEGSHHSMLNRWGWHSHRRTFSGSDRRVVVIGDSFIEALEVRQRDNVGAQLEALLPDTQVVTLGRGATGPGHYIEVLRYALDYFQPDDVIVSFFLGNDFSDSFGQDVVGEQLEHELLYSVDRAGQLQLHPSTAILPETYQYRLYYNHAITPLTVCRGLLSHHLLLGLGRDLWTRKAALLMPPPDFVPSDELPRQRMAEGEPMRLASALLKQAATHAQQAGVGFSVVTIPNFPEGLYLKDPTSVPELHTYGPLRDEQQLTEILQQAGIPAQPLGARIIQQRRTVAEIEALFIDGHGHFTPHGHAWFAEALCDLLNTPCSSNEP